MSRLSPNERNRFLELLADDMLGMLDAADRSEFVALRDRAGADEVTYDDIVAGLVLAADDPREGDMPAESAARLKSAGRSMLATAPTLRVTDAPQKSGVAPALAWAGWLAAAAGFILAATLWMNQSPRPVATPPAPTIVQNLDDLIDQPDTLVVPFTAQGPIADRAEAGDLVWNERLQRGFLRVKALDQNDPAAAQYQLWIFDKTREQYAVDGGVFDVVSTQPVDAQGRTIIPFAPALRIGDPAAFAVTIERPGGVVVTDQSGLVLLAPVGG
jgi:hypothetical protein